MPSIETVDRHQDAVLWPYAGVDRYGEPIRASRAIPLKVRWTWLRREEVDPQGNSINIDAEIVLDRKVTVGDTMWLGCLADWTGTAVTEQDNELMRVATYKETMDIKNRYIRRVAGLMRLKNTLPSTS